MTWMQGGARVYENLYVGVSKEMGVFTGKKCRPTPPTHGNVIKLVGGQIPILDDKFLYTSHYLPEKLLGQL